MIIMIQIHGGFSTSPCGSKSSLKLGPRHLLKAWLNQTFRTEIFSMPLLLGTYSCETEPSKVAPPKMSHVWKNDSVPSRFAKKMKPWKGHEKPVKTPWRGNEKHAKSCLWWFVRKGEETGFCNHIFSWELLLYVAAAGLMVQKFWICSRYELFEAFSHLGPLLKQPPKPVLWTDWVYSFDPRGVLISICTKDNFMVHRLLARVILQILLGKIMENDGTCGIMT